MTQIWRRWQIAQIILLREKIESRSVNNRTGFLFEQNEKACHALVRRHPCIAVHNGNWFSAFAGMTNSLSCPRAEGIETV
jgi:hypothetical protein